MRTDFEIALGIAGALGDIAGAVMDQTSKSLRRYTRRGIGRTLRPGASTPLWNELTARSRNHLSKRGSKAQLARILGVPRQRLQDCLKTRSACLDAERTLLLMCWVQARERGEKPS
jgi:hypothetical protein